MRAKLSAIIMIGLALGAGALGAFAAKKKTAAAKPAAMTEHQRALQALNRLAFGPRPGEVEQVEKLGVEKWIEQQLHPEKISDAVLEARLAPYRTLAMGTQQLMDNFPPPQVLKQIADGQRDLPSDPAKRAVYEAALEKYEARQANKNGGQNAADATMPPNREGVSDAEREQRMYAELNAGSVLDLPPDQRYQAIMKMSPEERDSLEQSLDNRARQQLLANLKPAQRETLEALQNPQRVVVEEMAAGKLLRAIYSERQLEEVMTDFWFNHFNVFLNKGPERYLIPEYEREVIRPRALGKFQDLLLATARSPAMLFYLDNWQSVGPDSAVARGIPPQQQNGGLYVDRFGRVRRRPGGFNRRPPNAKQNPNQQRRGLNENYAREIMELHTLGVDGGYTQKDVTELAKILTGWTIQQPQKGGGFTFNQRMHEPGNKVFLGKVFHEDGEKEGLKALSMLAHSPATAHFISKELAMRLVSDDPPEALVERMAETFTKTDGDIREVLRTLFRAPQFWAAGDYRAKVKTPLEFVVSALRATGADVSNPQPLIGALNRMGMPLYGMQPPTGYSMKAEAWVNSAALINRMNFALQLGSGHMPGVQPDENLLLGARPPADAAAATAMLEQDFLDGDVSQQTHAVILKQLTDPQVTGRRLDDPARSPNYGVIAGLILGSPEFQRR